LNSFEIFYDMLEKGDL